MSIYKLTDCMIVLGNSANNSRKLVTENRCAADILEIILNLWHFQKEPQYENREPADHNDQKSGSSITF